MISIETKYYRHNSEFDKNLDDCLLNQEEGVLSFSKKLRSNININNNLFYYEKSLGFCYIRSNTSIRFWKWF